MIQLKKMGVVNRLTTIYINNLLALGFTQETHSEMSWEDGVVDR